MPLAGGGDFALGAAAEGVCGLYGGFVDLRFPLGRFGVGSWKLDVIDSKDCASCVPSSSSLMGCGILAAGVALTEDLVRWCLGGAFDSEPLAEKPITPIRRPMCCCASENSRALAARSSRKACT